MRRATVAPVAIVALVATLYSFSAGFSPLSAEPEPVGAGASATLAQKAEQCEDDLFNYFLQDGLIIWSKADPTGQARYTNENSGCANGSFLSGLSYKWSVTRDPQTRQHAQQIAASLGMLETITGVPGMTSRQFKLMQGPGEDEASWLQDYWHQVGPYRWLGNVSTDEMTWYLTGLCDYVMLCADGEERCKATALIRRVVGRMLDHGMRIVDLDGSTTFWGDCSRETPREPLFCLHGLHYLKVAELCAGDQRFAEAYEQYAADGGYFENAVHCYERALPTGDWASYDWELAAPGFELLIKSDKDAGRRARLTEGLKVLAAAPNAQVQAHLATGVLGLGGGDQVRRWLEEFDPNGKQGPSLAWYHWAYWRARAGRIVAGPSAGG